MSFTAAALLFACAMFAGVLVFLALGRWLAERRGPPVADADDGSGPVSGAVFALFGLLVAFSFSGAAARFERGRELVVVEANAIETAYLHIDLLPADAQPELRGLYRRYVESRIATYRKLPDVGAARAERDRSVALQAEIWSRTLSAAMATHDPDVLTLAVTAVSEMIGVTTERLAALRTHQPVAISAMLVGLALLAALMAGHAMRSRRGWLHSIVFAVVISTALYVILELEYPRLGRVRVDDADVFLVEVLQSMK